MSFTLVPVCGDGFVDREKLLGEMFAELGNPGSTAGYAIFGKRRVGKTSVLKELQLRLQNTERIVPVYFSVWDLVEPSLSEFCSKLSVEILEAYRLKLGLGYRIRELLRAPISLVRQVLDRAELKVIYREVEFLLSFRSGEVDLDGLVENTFTQPERLSGDMKCVLLIDEFPSILHLRDRNSAVGEAIVRKIRTISEGWRRTCLCISGSIRSTMELAVLSSASPFYRQLIVREVKPLERRWVRELVLGNLPDATEDAVDEIYKFSNGIPFYVQFLGKMLERKKGKVSADEVRKAEEEFLLEEGDIIFKEEFEKLGPKERLVLVTVAKGHNTPKGIAGQIGERVSNVNRFLSYLEEKGQVYRREKGVYEVEDPVFARWLKEKVT